MCLINTPSTSNKASQQKDPPVLRNPYLDGIDPVVKAARSGASALRIDRSTGAATTNTTSAVQAPAMGQPVDPSVVNSSNMSRLTSVSALDRLNLA